MITSVKKNLLPLLESQRGPHFTAYIPRESNPIFARRRIRESIQTGRMLLQPALEKDQLDRFFEPLEALIDDTRLIRKVRGHMGLFRNQEAFRLLKIPVEVDPTCIVAESFHVKPLLRWLQTDDEFYLLGVTQMSVSLYHGGLDTLTLVDTVYFPEPLLASSGLGSYEELKRDRNRRLRMNETMAWVADWLESQSIAKRTRLNLAGESDLLSALSQHIPQKLFEVQRSWAGFSQHLLPDMHREISLEMKRETKLKLERAMIEYYQADDMSLAKKNIFQVAKAAVSGRVRKLIVAEGVHIFGQLDRKTGGLSIHPAQMNHQDDDILDDLAQTVLSHGGEVVVAKIEEMPKRYPLLAILETPETVAGAGLVLDRGELAKGLAR